MGRGDGCLCCQEGKWFESLPVKSRTPRKTNMEPKHHAFEKEKHLNQIFIVGFKMLNFGGVCLFPLPERSITHRYHMIASLSTSWRKCFLATKMCLGTPRGFQETNSTKDHLTLQWKGERTCRHSRGLLVLK